MAPTAVLIPGNMCDARLWDGDDARLRRALEERGMPVVDADTASDDAIAAMAARALAQRDGPLLPIGFSMGAIIGLEMFRQAPDRIAGLALFGLNAGADLADRSAARIRQKAEVGAGGLERVLIEELKPNYLARRNRGDAALLALLRDMGLSLGADVFVRQSEALRLRADLRPVLGEIRVPALLGCGAEDALCPPAWHADWASRIADASQYVQAGAGHMLPLEAPLELSDTIMNWLASKELVR